jgi:membrane-associated phospholipid phosphatase
MLPLTGMANDPSSPLLEDRTPAPRQLPASASSTFYDVDVLDGAAIACVFGGANERLPLQLHPNRRSATTNRWIKTGVKALKPGCGRPDRHLENVSVRGQPQTGLGYPSGHAAVALTLALIAARTDKPRIRTGAITATGLTGAARMYVGAHLPLDIAGGFAIGALAGQAANAVTERCSGAEC